MARTKVNRAQHMAKLAKATRAALRANDCEAALSAFAHFNYARGAYGAAREAMVSRPVESGWKMTTGVMLDLKQSVASCFRKRRK